MKSTAEDAIEQLLSKKDLNLFRGDDKAFSYE